MPVVSDPGYHGKLGHKAGAEQTLAGLTCSLHPLFLSPLSFSLKQKQWQTQVHTSAHESWTPTSLDAPTSRT